jgi:hypothetical protein
VGGITGLTSGQQAGLAAVRQAALALLGSGDAACATPEGLVPALLSVLVLQQMQSTGAPPPPFTLEQLERLLERYTHQVEESRWFVAGEAAGGQAVITVAEPTGIPAVLPGVVSTYQGAKVVFVSGGNAGMRTAIASLVYADGALTVTLADNLLRPAVVGDRLVVERVVPSAAAAQSVNLTQVGGTALAGANWTADFQYLQNLAPITTSTAPRGLTVGTSAVQLDTGLAGRRGIIVTNTDATNPLFVGATDAVTTSATPATCGIYVAPNGGSYQYALSPAVEVWGIAPANIVVSVQELA